ncbi:helix-turn-helix transcriptional regulator [Vibrio sp. JPW-9-11-11]|nr:helix-turn-helix transcriptional regulator [Vibrio sp. JPW-9-11-11]
MKNRQKESRHLQTNVPKVVLTQTVVENDKQVIMSQTRFNNTPIVEGKLINYEVPQCFAIYGGQSIELLDSHVVASTSAAMIITVVLEGSLTFGYDELEFTVDGNAQPQAILVNLTQAASFHRSIEKHNQLLKVNLLFHSQWVTSRLSELGNPFSFTNRHLNYVRSHVSPKMRQLVLSLLQSEQPQSFSARLKLESLALQIVQEMFDHLPASHGPFEQSALPNAGSNRVKDVLNYIERHLMQTLTIDAIATHFSMSSSNLQRIFRSSVGVTINSYIRQRRLMLAKHNLEKGLVTITEAAYEAGYNHPANFTHAFKKAFGVPPAKVVKHV